MRLYSDANCSASIGSAVADAAGKFSLGPTNALGSTSAELALRLRATDAAKWTSACTVGPTYHLDNVEHDITRAVRYRSFKLHFNRLSREYRLYDLARDPSEQEDIAAGDEDTFAALTGRLEGFLAAEKIEAPVRALSEEEIEKLRSLGYLR